MRATIELLEIEDAATTVRITDNRGRTAEVKVFGDGSRMVLSGPSYVMDNLIRAGQKAMDKNAFRAAVQSAREEGKTELR